MNLNFESCNNIFIFLKWVLENKEDTNQFYSNTMNAFVVYYKTINDIRCFDGTHLIIIPFQVMMDVSSIKRKYYSDFKLDQQQKLSAFKNSI